MERLTNTNFKFSMKIHQTQVIPQEFSGKRIDQIAQQIFPKISRSQWKNSGEFFLQNKKLSPSYKAKPNQEITFQYQEKSIDLTHIPPWDFPLEILKETEDYLIINKPIGISVHPSLTEKHDKTMVNALVHYLGKNISENFDMIENQKIPRPGIVHRLDKTTSGVLLIAKNNKTHKFFQDNWKNFKKFYYALIPGTPPKKGEIIGAIIRDPKNRHKMTVSPQNDSKGKPAHTLFKLQEFSAEKNLSLLKIELLTGRTHQIRAHFSSINFPLLGDEIYNGKKSERIFLHATELQFQDPKTKKNISISSPLPPEFQSLLH